MEYLPQTLEETIAMVQTELRQLIPTSDLDKKEEEATKRLLGWLEELHNLKTDDAAAIENAIDALKRIVDGIEMNPLVNSADKHYKNRLNKLINNLEEVIELESKKENRKNDRSRLPEKHGSSPQGVRTEPKPPRGRGHHIHRRRG